MSPLTWTTTDRGRLTIGHLSQILVFFFFVHLDTVHVTEDKFQFVKVCEIEIDVVVGYAEKAKKKNFHCECVWVGTCQKS